MLFHGAGVAGFKYCVGLASGLDALWISFRSLDIGAEDEVIVCANAYIVCVTGITINGVAEVARDASNKICVPASWR